MKLQIGNLELSSNILLGPMAGVTESPFRRLCREAGCGLLFTEMVSAKGLYYQDPKTAALMAFAPEEAPVGLQLFGSDPGIFEAVMPAVNVLDHALIDLNLGCPAPKIVKNGDGSALMKDLKRAEAVIRAVVGGTRKPVTVKIRKGWDETSVNAVEAAQMAEAAGASAVTVHGRTREQFYSGQADWDIIKEVKRALKIPVIGNGDIFAPQDALRMMAHTGCDGVMVARGAQGRPWLFTQINACLEGQPVPPDPSAEERIPLILRHLEALIALEGEYIAVLEMRKHIAWYLKGLHGSARIKQLIHRAVTAQEVTELLEHLRHQAPAGR